MKTSVLYVVLMVLLVSTAAVYVTDDKSRRDDELMEPYQQPDGEYVQVHHNENVIQHPRRHSRHKKKKSNFKDPVLKLAHDTFQEKENDETDINNLQPDNAKATNVEKTSEDKQAPRQEHTTQHPPATESKPDDLHEVKHAENNTKTNSALDTYMENNDYVVDEAGNLNDNYYYDSLFLDQERHDVFQSNHSLGEDYDLKNDTTDEAEPFPKVSQCPTCDIRASDMKYRIESLKNQILKTLQIKKLPNVTGVHKPKVPALQRLYDLEDSDMTEDQEKVNGYNDDDDFILKTERIFTTSKLRKYYAHSYNRTK